jgi:alpha-tubulin suppressor-like RCC1 family protein
MNPRSRFRALLTPSACLVVTTSLGSTMLWACGPEQVATQTGTVDASTPPPAEDAGGQDATSTADGGTDASVVVVGPRVLDLAARGESTCALLENGIAKCWGVGGALGIGDTKARGNAPGQMGANLPNLDMGPGRSIVAFAVGERHTCGRLDNATVKCWGTNYAGELGLGDNILRGDDPGEMGANLPPVDVGGDVAQLAVDDGHSCAVLGDGRVKCWGTNFNGKLGLGDEKYRGSAVGHMGAALPAVDLGVGVIASRVVAGREFNCAQVGKGAIKCWGANSEGELGLGDTKNRGALPGHMGANLPNTDLGSASEIKQLVAGLVHACALFADGSVKCWGSNRYSQLGLGDSQARGDAPNEMGTNLPALNFGPGRSAVQLAAGTYHTCAILDDGTVRCWGSNNDGELGYGDRQFRGDGAIPLSTLPPVDLGPARTAKAIAAGSAHNCVVTNTNAVVCWGRNMQGNLGVGDTKGRGDDPRHMGSALVPVTLE